MTMLEKEMSTTFASAIIPGSESERKVLVSILENEWQDHFHTRNQTWKTLDIDGILVVALLGISWQLHNYLATSLVAGLLILTAFFGACITIHHRSVEVSKFTHIKDIEEKLGVIGLLKDTQLPYPIKWYKVFQRKHFSTSSFILLTHYIILIFGFVYLIFSIIYLK
jgi:hypothetical protein